MKFAIVFVVFVLFPMVVLSEEESNIVMIQNPHSGLVIEGHDEYGEVTLEVITDKSSQYWIKEQGSEDHTFLLINNETGYVLTKPPTLNLITAPQTGRKNQQWYVNSNETIATAMDESVIDITDGIYKAGNKLRAIPSNGEDNQDFKLIDINLNNK